MNRRSVRRFCVGMVLFAACVRAFCAAGAMRVSAPAPAVWPVVLLTADEPAAPAEAAPEIPEIPTEETASAPAPPAEKDTAAPLTFDASEADAISITGGCTYAVDKAALLTRPSALDFSADGPKVLIVHTHSSEAYTQEAGNFYPESDPLRTEDAQFSVIRVGDRVAEILTARGIETLHDTALNDYPTYTGAYDRMKTTIEGYLQQYPSIQMVIDIHRDAASWPDGSQVAFTAEAGGEQCARLMLVVGTDEGGLPHPNWQENLANALKLQALLNRAAPGLCRDIDLRTERFNQHETPGSLLVEFGCTGNTLTEALHSAACFGTALADLVQAQNGA